MMKNIFNTVLGIAAVGGICYLIYKADKKRKERLEIYKKAAVGDRNITEEIIKASLDNANFADDPSDASKAYDVLMRQYVKMKVAYTCEEFDKTFNKLQEMMDNLTNNKIDKAEAWLIIYHDELAKEEMKNEESKRKLEDELRHARKERTELEKAKTIAKAIDGLGTAMKRGSMSASPVRLQDIIDVAESITITM